MSKNEKSLIYKKSEYNGLLYEVIASGSKGNAIKIHNILIDCGIPFKNLKEHLYDVDYLLITHCHSDHLKIGVLKSIKKYFPRIHIMGNEEVANACIHEGVLLTGVLTHNQAFVLGGTKVLPFHFPHGSTLCTAFVLYFPFLEDGILVATDGNSLENCPDERFEMMFLEGNFCKQRIQEAFHKEQRFGYDYLNATYRHLSIQEMKRFYYTHRNDRFTPLIQLHVSGRFGYFISTGREKENESSNDL